MTKRKLTPSDLELLPAAGAIARVRLRGAKDLEAVSQAIADQSQGYLQYVTGVLSSVGDGGLEAELTRRLIDKGRNEKEIADFVQFTMAALELGFLPAVEQSVEDQAETASQPVDEFWP